MKNFLTDRCIRLFATITLVLFVSVDPLSAEMLQLSRFQSSIFHIAPVHSEVDPYRFKDDALIDNQQAEEFIKASEVEIYLPADHDNYPFSVVDHFILDTDLVIPIKHESILYPYPRAIFLSRHDISLVDYTGIALPPEVYISPIKGYEPYHNQRVEAMSMQLTNYHVHQDEWLTESPSPGEEGFYCGRMVNGTVISNGCVSVWVNDETPRALNNTNSDLNKPNGSCP